MYLLLLPAKLQEHSNISPIDTSGGKFNNLQTAYATRGIIVNCPSAPMKTYFCFSKTNLNYSMLIVTPTPNIIICSITLILGVTQVNVEGTINEYIAIPIINIVIYFDISFPIFYLYAYCIH